MIAAIVELLPERRHAGHENHAALCVRHLGEHGRQLQRLDVGPSNGMTRPSRS